MDANFLNRFDKGFTWISKKVLDGYTFSIVSYNPAEIIHHIERRLTNPIKILDATNLVPLTAFEHEMVHVGRIKIVSVGEGVFAVIDLHGAHFLANTAIFMKRWNKYLAEWQELNN